MPFLPQTAILNLSFENNNSESHPSKKPTTDMNTVYPSRVSQFPKNSTIDVNFKESIEDDRDTIIDKAVLIMNRTVKFLRCFNCRFYLNSSTQTGKTPEVMFAGRTISGVLMLFLITLVAAVLITYLTMKKKMKKYQNEENIQALEMRPISVSYTHLTLPTTPYV